jgi:ATP/maltotriose-dependent transcriptional regulator MalT
VAALQTGGTSAGGDATSASDGQATLETLERNKLLIIALDDQRR